MTLLEMIKKYEDAKAILEKQRPELPILASMGDVNQILEDLREVLKDTSEISINNLTLEKLKYALTENNFDDAQKLTHIYSMLPE